MLLLRMPWQAEVDEQFVLAKCGSFIDVQLWPLEQKLSPRRWLDNFDSHDREYAIALLNAFIYFSESLVDQMFRAAVQRLSTIALQTEDSFFKMRSSWNSFLDTAVVTYITGETPSPTDSGNYFSRKARQVLGFPEDRILNPQDAALLLLSGGSARPVLFVDDFVGSANQFIETWKRPVQGPGKIEVSFEKLALMTRASFFYCPVLCTEIGLARIHSECPGVTVSPAHVLSSRYSALASGSIIWPPNLAAGGPDFIRRYSITAGIPDDLNATDYWKGFQSLGLAVAFAHAVPDATMPIFYWEMNGWSPLIRRT